MSSSILRYEAVGLSQPLDEGTTLPLVLDCASSETKGLVPVFTKYVQYPRFTPDHMLREMLGVILARRLGVPTPDFSFVDVSHEAAEIINADIADRGMDDRHIMPGVALGFEFLPHLVPMPVPPNIDGGDKRLQAQLLFALDLCLQNCDRMPENPNCAYHQGGIVAFDFENCLECDPAFMAQGKAFEVAEHRGGPDHLFYSKLKGRAYDWNHVLAWAAANGRSALRQLITIAPVEWHGRAQSILDFMEELSDGSGELPVQLDWSLA